MLFTPRMQKIILRALRLSAWRSSLIAESSLQESSSEAEGRPQGLQQFFRLKKESVEALRYRGEDVLKSLTKRAVREARARDLKLEILNCSKLQVWQLVVYTHALAMTSSAGFHQGHSFTRDLLTFESQHLLVSCCQSCTPAAAGLQSSRSLSPDQQGA